MDRPFKGFAPHERGTLFFFSAESNLDRAEDNRVTSLREKNCIGNGRLVARSLPGSIVQLIIGSNGATGGTLLALAQRS